MRADTRHERRARVARIESHAARARAAAAAAPRITATQRALITRRATRARAAAFYAARAMP